MEFEPLATAEKKTPTGLHRVRFEIMFNQEQYDHRALTKYNFIFLVAFLLQNAVSLLSDSRARLRELVPLGQGFGCLSLQLRAKDSGPCSSGFRMLVSPTQSSGYWFLLDRI